MTGAELCAHFDVEPDALREFLLARHILFHTDSSGQLWASLDHDQLLNALPAKEGVSKSDPFDILPLGDRGRGTYPELWQPIII